jgi:hypothetical protein
MSDGTINQFVGTGTTAERTAFVPDPPSPVNPPGNGYTFWDTDTQTLYAWDVGAADWVAAGGASTQPVTVGVTVDGGGEVISTGQKGYLQCPITGTITSWTLLADQSGSTVIDVWKDTYANAPPTDADSITAAAPPTLSSATKATNSTLTGWTTAVTAGDVFGFNVDSATTLQRVTLQLVVSP